MLANRKSAHTVKAYLHQRVPIEILPGKRHIMWVLTVSLFSAEFQMEPLAPNVIHYYT